LIFATANGNVCTGNSLLRKLSLAIPQAVLHSRAFHALTEGLRVGHEEELQEWERMVQEWDQDQEKPCPYEYSEHEGK
jgi:hypothetical protein